MEVILEAEPESITLDTERTALVVVDMQNAFCKKGGLFDYIGRLDEDRTKCMIKADKVVISLFRRMGIKVIYLRMTYGLDVDVDLGPDSPYYWKESGLMLIRDNPELKGKFLTEGTWDWEIVDELKPSAEDIVVNKSRFSGFVNTELDSILKSNRMKYVVFTGLFTNICVESTLRDAFFHEYFPVLVSDACGNTGPDYLQDATVWNVTSVFGWVTTTENLTKAMK